MSVNTLESPWMRNQIAQKQNSELIYRLEDRPPPLQTLFRRLPSILLAMFVAVITPGLLICGRSVYRRRTRSTLSSMSLFASGVASIIQIKAWGPVWVGIIVDSGHQL